MIIGNGGGGKSTLARHLSRSIKVPLHPVDSIQYLPGWKVLDRQSCDAQLDKLTEAEAWIIDGFGSREATTRRMALANTVIFVDCLREDSACALNQ